MPLSRLSLPEDRDDADDRPLAGEKREGGRRDLLADTADGQCELVVCRSALVQRQPTGQSLGRQRRAVELLSRHHRDPVLSRDLAGHDQDQILRLPLRLAHRWFHTSRCSITSPSASNRRRETPARSSLDPSLSRVCACHSTAARSPATIGSWKTGVAVSSSAKTCCTYSAAGCASRKGCD